MPATTPSINCEMVQHAHNKSNEKQEQKTTNIIDEEKNESSSLSSSYQQRPLLLNKILLPFFESTFTVIYRGINFCIHFGSVITFLAFIAVWCLGSFHDRYFLTILHRARRTDIDLQHEITYYHRQCTLMDVTVRPNLNDPSELFIELPSPIDENNEENDEHGDKSVKYQHIRRRRRRRRRFAPSVNSWESQILPPISKSAAKKAGTKAVDTIMKHGAVMVQQMLSDTTIKELREFLIQKNEIVFGTLAEYPMSQSHHRISYGIEATEHKTVIRALKEIHDHAIFAYLIKNLVGDDNPALSEITAITAWAGAAPQGWHPDVKPDGNGVKFGRTYSHSYSLFLPLQDTTEDMGPTDLCPGTHYCADDDLWDVCEANRIGLNEIRPQHTGGRDDKDDEYQYEIDGKEGIWRAGDGALLNQQVWHRGTAHIDEEEPDRVMFVVSFLRRPVADDPRQLARGTYFHQKWLNWGSTWQDMTDAASSLKRPWNILRCLHIWKSSDRQWGYDLFTATSLRIANSQMGGEPSDLESLIDNVMTPFHFPEWLQGSIDYESPEAWQIYLRETIRNTYEFLKRVNCHVHIIFVLFLLMVLSISYLYNCLIKRHSQQQQHHQHPIFRTVFKRSAQRLAWTHGSVFVLGLYTWHTVRSSKWATDIDSGTTLMRPFPSADFIDNDPSVQGGLTTLPRRFDVLIGTRFDTKSIGAYRKWLDYHPGNRIFDGFVDLYGGKFYHLLLLKKYNNDENINVNSSSPSSPLPVRLIDQLTTTALQMIEKHHGGRFLMQDYRTGDWKIMGNDESEMYARTRLFIGGDDTILAALKEAIDFLLDKYRFGVPRKTRSMSWNSQLFLVGLSKDLFTPAFLNCKETVTTAGKKENTTKLTLPSGVRLSSMHLPRSFLHKVKSIHPTTTNSLDTNGIRTFLLGMSLPSLHAGKEIYYIAWKHNIDDDDYDHDNDDDDDDDDFDLYPGIVIDISTENYRDDDDGYVGYHIAFYDDGVQSLEMVDRYNVQRNALLIREPTKEGSRVEVIHRGRKFIGVVLLVVADGTVDIKLDVDGSIVTNIPLTEYNLLLND